MSITVDRPSPPRPALPRPETAIPDGRGRLQSPRRSPALAPEARRPPRRIALLALAAYVAYAVFQTWPLATDPFHLLAGASVGPDFGAGTATMAYLVGHHLTPFLPATLHGFNAPDGQPVPWVLNWVSAPSVALQYGLSLVFGPVAGSNALLWLSMVASAMAMFLLCRRTFEHAGAAFVAGLAFGFSPFVVQQIGGHPVYGEGWVLVIVVWRMLELIDRPTRGRALWAGTAAAGAMWFTPYFILFAGLLFATLCAVFLVTSRIRHQGRRALGLTTLATTPIIALFGALGVFVHLTGGAAAGGAPTRQINEFYAFAARPAEWVLPDRRNPIFGHFTWAYLTNHLDGSNFAEASIYLGVSVLLLALVGAIWATRQLRSRRRTGLGDRRVVATIAGVCIALVAATFSLPPGVSIAHHDVLLPEGFVFLVTSAWRVASRQVEVIELGLCLALAGGVNRLLSGRRRAVSATLLAMLVVIVGLDLWARPVTRAVSTEPPPAYAWLAAHPGGIVADYPLQYAAFPYYSSLFWASVDHHPAFQGYASGSVDEGEKTGLADLRDPDTAGGLADFGVHWVVVHPGQPGGSPAAMARRGYRMRFANRWADVYEVLARPARARVDLMTASPVLGPAGAEYRWLDARSDVLRITVRDCAACTGTLRLRSRSYRISRVLTVREGAGGRRLAHVSVSAGRSVPLIVPGIHVRDGVADLELSTTGAPSQTPARDIMWPGVVSVSVQMPSFRLDRR